MERTIDHNAVSVALNLAMQAGYDGMTRISLPMFRTDVARNKACLRFQEAPDPDPDDVLVMLDCDQLHPQDTLGRLAGHVWANEDVDVVAALSFRRGEPYDPMFWTHRDEHGAMVHGPIRAGLQRGICAATGAFAIRRRLFAKLQAAGVGFPWFYYTYPPQVSEDTMPTEDTLFCRTLENLGLPIWCDTDLISPHLLMSVADDQTWDDWRADHPEAK